MGRPKRPADVHPRETAAISRARARRVYRGQEPARYLRASGLENREGTQVSSLVRLAKVNSPARPERLASDPTAHGDHTGERSRCR
jgi:GAF domain-containing protein